MDARQQIEALVRGWAEAVARSDLDGVLPGHAEDIVMFDVPPPHGGHRGLAEYAASWPAFLEWQASGAVFEITELEVVAGEDVAYAYALLRCGKPERFEEDPDHRLRLTLGVRREDGRWVVAHEHHSFALES